MKKRALFFLMILTFTAPAIANQCSQIFFRDPFAKQEMSPGMASALKESVKSLFKSTTGARVEKKWTLLTSKVSLLIDGLGRDLAKFQVLISARDKVTAGFVNVTHTIYLDQYRINLKNSGFEMGEGVDLTDVTVKPRKRKYGTIATNRAVAIKNVVFAPFTKEYSFFEFKFPDARFNGAVFKPRMYIADKYLAMLGTAEFLKNYEVIVRETLALELNKSNPESVEAMLLVLKLGHHESATFREVAVNLYERISLAIDFFDTVKNAFFQVQITLDKSISLFVYEYGKTIQAYAPEDSVIEIKIPVEYAGIKLSSDATATEKEAVVSTTSKSGNKLGSNPGTNPGTISGSLPGKPAENSIGNIPGYETFLKFVNSVQSNHLKDKYMEGVGKNGHGHRGYLRAIGVPQ